jgi:hypothetical protein
MRKQETGPSRLRALGSATAGSSPRREERADPSPLGRTSAAAGMAPASSWPISVSRVLQTRCQAGSAVRDWYEGRTGWR